MSEKIHGSMTGLLPNGLAFLMSLFSKISNFWWRVVQNAIPTKAWLLKRGLTEAALCPWGCQEIENRSHIVSSCLLLKSVAQSLANWGFSLPTFASVTDALRGLTQVCTADIPSARMFCYAVHHCWRARNAKVHGQTHGTPVTLAVSILEALTDMHLFPFREQWNASQPKRLLSPSFWHPPSWMDQDQC